MSTSPAWISRDRASFTKSTTLQVMARHQGARPCGSRKATQLSLTTG
jgi:hypothetical protein